MANATDKPDRCLAKDVTDYTVTRVSTTVTVENPEDSTEEESVLKLETAPPTVTSPHLRQGDSASATGRECIRKLLQTAIDSTAVRYLLIIAALIVLIVVCDRFVVSQDPTSTTTVGEELRRLLSKTLIQSLQESATGFSVTTPSVERYGR